MTLQKHQTAFIYRLQFARRGSLSYVGHLDLMRTFERSLRRAGLPILHSQGYNPRPMLVFALPLGVGISTSDDYIDVSLSEETDVSDLIGTLQKYVPDGLEILSGRQVPETGGSIMAVVTAASYRLRAPRIAEALRNLMNREEVLAEKKSKGQIRKLDIRPLILRIIADDRASGDEVTVLVRAGSHENLRPDLLLAALTAYEDYPQEDAANCEVERTGLFTGTYPDLIRLKEMR